MKHAKGTRVQAISGLLGVCVYKERDGFLDDSGRLCVAVCVCVCVLFLSERMKSCIHEKISVTQLDRSGGGERLKEKLRNNERHGANRGEKDGIKAIPELRARKGLIAFIKSTER